MRVKTSITIDERVLKAIDKVATARAARGSRDLAILNESATDLNKEMEDVLAYQADI